MESGSIIFSGQVFHSSTPVNTVILGLRKQTNTTTSHHQISFKKNPWRPGRFLISQIDSPKTGDFWRERRFKFWYKTDTKLHFTPSKFEKELFGNLHLPKYAYLEWCTRLLLLKVDVPSSSNELFGHGLIPFPTVKWRGVSPFSVGDRRYRDSTPVNPVWSSWDRQTTVTLEGFLFV